MVCVRIPRDPFCQYVNASANIIAPRCGFVKGGIVFSHKSVELVVHVGNIAVTLQKMWFCFFAILSHVPLFVPTQAVGEGVAWQFVALP